MDGDGVVSTLRALSRAPLGTRGERATARNEQAQPVAGNEQVVGEDAYSDSPTSHREVAVRLFEAFNRRDLLSALSLMHPEIVFRPMTAAVTRAGEPYRGHEGMRRYVEDVEHHWEELTIHPAQIRSAGRAVVALGLVSGRGLAGAFEDAPTTWVLKFRDGLVVHAQIFSDARNIEEALVTRDE